MVVASLTSIATRVAVVTDDDHVDLVVAVARAQVTDHSVGPLRRDPDAQRGQRFEEMAEHRPGLRADRAPLAVHQGGKRHS